MRGSSTYDLILNAIYAASLNASLWPRALELIRAETGDVGVLLGIGRGVASFQNESPVNSNLQQRECEIFPLLQTVGMDMSLWPIFVERHIENPISATAAQLPLFQPAEASRFIERQEIVKMDLYKDVFEPQDILDNTNVVLGKEGGELQMLVLMRSASTETVDPNTPLLARLAPHLARALDIMHALSTTADKAVNFATTVAGSNRVAFMLDARGTVVDVSPNASRFVGPGRPFRLSKEGVLRLTTTEDTARLHAAVASAMDGRAPSPRPKAAIVATVDPATYRKLSIVVLPSRQLQDNAILANRIAAIVVARDVSWGSEHKACILMDAYGLTAREAQVVVALIETGALTDAAPRLRVKLSTAQSHLKSVLHKIGVSSQVALVAQLCAEFPQLVDV